MRVGLFFGSFNPIHIGHMALANYMLEFGELDEVWFVVSPHNPLKQKATLLDQNHRLLLVNLAIDDHKGMRSSNIEFSMPQPSYTVNTLARLGEKFPDHHFSLIIGQDNLESFPRWKNYETILSHYRLLVYPRPGCTPTELEKHPSVVMTSAPIIDISSTFIRQSIQKGHNMRFFVPEKVWEEIDVMNFYRR